MALDISCPHCQQNFHVVEAFAGSRVECPHCNGGIILDIQAQVPSRRPVVPPASGPRVYRSDDEESLIAAASNHLANWLDVSLEEIHQARQQIANNTAYESWQIPKGQGPFFRSITAPVAGLKTIQRRILDRLLYRVPVSNAAHGFVPGRSIVTNAMRHLPTARAIYNLDLKDAFPSVDATKVKHLYVRYLKIPLKHLGEEIAHPVLDKVIELLVEFTTYQGRLPQGSPASGCLLNLACLTLDKNLFRRLQSYQSSYKYTRYADDITISSPQPIPEELRKQIDKDILNCGFQVNPTKVSYAEKDKGQRLEVTGLILEKGKIRIPAKKLDEFRATIHQASLVSPEELTPEKKLEVQSIYSFVKMVYDRLPHRIWGPYKDYLEKHKLPVPRTSTRPHWEQYPK